MSTTGQLWACLLPCWLGLLMLCFVSEVSLAAQRSIFTIPLTTNNTFATSYANLIVSAQFPTSDVSATCVWNYPGRTTSSFIVVVIGITCNPVNNPPVETVSCANDGTTITSDLTILQPLSAGSLDVTVECDGRTILTLPSTAVQDCPSNISSDITVQSTTYTYNVSGTFQCSNNGELFYSNGTRPSSNDTTCLASATWSGQDDLQCWSAPNASLVDNLGVVEGNDLTLTCDYVDTIPSGNLSIFYVGDNNYTIPKNEPLILPFLNKTCSNIAVSCQALTPFTEISTYSDRGISLIRNLIIIGCVNDGDIGIIVIFSLLILLCMGYNAWYVFAYTHDHPGEWHASDKAALITALIGLASFLGLLIGYSVNYQCKASCFSSGTYRILTPGELGVIIAGCSIFYLGCYISMLILYPKHKSANISTSPVETSPTKEMLHSSPNRNRSNKVQPYEVGLLVQTL